MDRFALPRTVDAAEQDHQRERPILERPLRVEQLPPQLRDLEGVIGFGHRSIELCGFEHRESPRSR
jgi:hypothetical protein